MKKQITVLAVAGALLMSAQVQARTVRAGDMTASQWSQLMSQGSEELTVEFRQGDEIPVSFGSTGDLLETTTTGVSYVKVKRQFWLQLGERGVQMSLDGNSFRPLQDVVTGSFSAGAGSAQPGIPVNAINLMLKANLK